MIELSEDAENAITDGYTRLIYLYLKQNYLRDPMLADALKKPNKTLKGVLNYIWIRARGKETNGFAAVPSTLVYAWVRSYLVNDNLDYEDVIYERDVDKANNGKTANKGTHKPSINHILHEKGNGSRKRRRNKKIHKQGKQNKPKDNKKPHKMRDYIEPAEETIKWFYRNFGVSEE